MSGEVAEFNDTREGCNDAGAEDPPAHAGGSDKLNLDPALNYLTAEVGISRAAAEQIVDYLAGAKMVLGVMPSQDNLVLERFFDDSGSMQLVLHSPFGSRLNRA